jgi:hypothetical protein
MTSVAIITTCKGRLAFLKQTLPLMVATGFPVTVVDYDCPEGTGDWVAANFPDVNLVRVKDRSFFITPKHEIWEQLSLQVKS